MKDEAMKAKLEAAKKKAEAKEVKQDCNFTKDPMKYLQTKSYSSNRMAGSFTSTGVDMAVTDSAVVTEVRRQLKPKKKGYVRLKTNFGDLNIELHCDKVPMTCENFIKLAGSGYYDGVSFHRNIKDFMIQGGDPTGTGMGGESFFGEKFEDEFRETLKHNGRGVLSMANAGPNTNGSQFFILYHGARHLDNKHTVFGKLVGGLTVLDKMEAAKTDKKDRPIEPVTIISATVFTDPFAEMLQAEKEEKEKEDAKKATHSFVDEDESGQWYSNPKPVLKAKSDKTVGKYMASASVAKEDSGEPASREEAPLAQIMRKKQKTSSFGNFSGW